MEIRAQLCIKFNSEFLVTDKWLNRALGSGFSERENTRWFGIYVAGCTIEVHTDLLLCSASSA